MNRETRTISRQELEGQRGHVHYGLIRIYPMGIMINAAGECGIAMNESVLADNRNPISGQPLIDELRKRGWTVTEEAPAGSRRYTAREWLERTLPVGWYYANQERTQIVNDNYGNSIGWFVHHRGRPYVMDWQHEGFDSIPRSEAIDLMAAAIEAGDQSGERAEVVESKAIAQPAKALGYHDVDEFYRDDQSTKPIDPHEFELVKAIVTWNGPDDDPSEAKAIVSFARRLLAEMRGGG